MKSYSWLPLRNSYFVLRNFKVSVLKLKKHEHMIFVEVNVFKLEKKLAMQHDTNSNL